MPARNALLKSPRGVRRPQARLAAGLLLPVLAWALQVASWGPIEAALEPHPFLLLLPAVYVAAWIDGMRGGLLATGIGGVLAYFAFFDPRFSWVLTDPRDGVSLILFMAVGVLFSLLHRHAARSARRVAAAEVVASDLRVDAALAEDRERIARDLHDIVMQRLFAAGMTLNAIERDAIRLTDEYASTHDVPAETLEKSYDIIQRRARVTDELDAVIDTIRLTIFDLREGNRSLGLRAGVLAAVCDAADKLGLSGQRVTFTGPVDTVIPAGIADAMIAVVTEALSNVVRHAHATTFTVQVAASGIEAAMCVTDDGIGMQPGDRAGHGLANMHARAADLGGTFWSGPAQPSGTVLRWTAPLVPAAARELAVR